MRKVTDQELIWSADDSDPSSSELDTTIKTNFRQLNLDPLRLTPPDTQGH